MRYNKIKFLVILLLFLESFNRTLFTKNVVQHRSPNEKDADNKVLSETAAKVEQKDANSHMPKKLNAGEILQWKLAKGIIDSKYFAKNFKKLFIDQFYPREKALTSSLFNYFSATDLAEIYKNLLPLFNEKLIWFYVGDKKSDLLPMHLDMLANELFYYLYYIENTNADVSQRKFKLTKKANSIKEAWLNNNDLHLKELYYDLVLVAYCYQIRRAAALVISLVQDYTTLIAMMNDPLPKARLLLGKLRGSEYHEQATTIFKNYEGVFNDMCKLYFPQQT